MAKPSPVRLFAAAFLLTVAASSAAVAQPDVPNLFSDTVDVVVIGIEAVVTDRRDNRVTGLGPKDFRLLVDGRETEIEYFSEVREGLVLAREAGGDTSSEDEPGHLQPATTNHLVFIDDFFAIRSPRNAVLKGLREDVTSLPPGDRMAIIAFDGDSLEVLAPWTSSVERLVRALDEARERRSYGLQRSSERLRRGEESPWSDSTAQARELERVFDAIRATLQLLPRPEGRKVLLLLGGAWPVNLFGVSSGGASDLDAWSSRLDARRSAARLADDANLLGYTVYPVDVQGLRSRDVPVERVTAGDGSSIGGGAPRSSGYTGELFRQDVLRLLAGATGGRALLFAERTSALETELADTRTYYSLGFTTRLRGDETRHAIRLEVRKAGLEVRTRTGYRDASRKAELDLLAESALRMDGTAETLRENESSPLMVSLGQPRRTERRTMVLPVRVEIPWQEITLLPVGRGFLARIEIRVAARDRRGEVSEIAHVPFNVVRETPPPPGRTIHWGADLTLRRERHVLLVSVYDTVANRTLMTRKLTVDP